MALPYTSILAGASGQSSGYSITNSARFVSGNSCELVFNPGVASTSQRKLTYSVWVKRVVLGARTGIIRGGTQDGLRWDVGDTLSIFVEQGVSFGITTTAVFRDTSAWYHIFAVIDTTNATTADRMQLWVNGVRQAVTGTCPTLNYDLIYFNKTGVNQAIGYNSVGVGTYADYYLSNFYGIDGQALTPSSFGQTNTSGVWVPKAYSGTYGTNGFLMAFLNSAALGTDTSGKGNTFTSSGLVAGDQMTDTPTLNYATMNPLAKGTMTVASGNLKVSAGSNSKILGNFGVTSGKWYFEATCNVDPGAASGFTVGVCTQNQVLTDNTRAAVYYGYRNDGNKWSDAVGSTAYGSTWTANDVIGVALDCTNQTIAFYKNNISQGTAFSGITVTNALLPMWHNEPGSSMTMTYNFGQTAFTYTPPTGFGALNTANLPAPAIKDGSAHFQTALHTGTGSALTINQSGNRTFTPDFVWTKGRSGTTDHILSNVISGTGKYLVSDTTAVEVTNAQALTAFGAGSISYGTMAAVNTNAATYVDWMWKGGGAGVSNSVGSITSTVSTNTTAGISIVTYTGTGANATVGHGLGVAPSMIIVKPKGSVVDNWGVYHASLGNTSRLLLNTTAAVATNATYWNSTSPTSSVFSLGTSGLGNAVDSYLALVFAPIAGFSAFGSYTGNGAADGPFIYTGFKPAWVMWKNASASATSWLIKDTSRDTYNVMTTRLFADNTNADDVNTSNDLIDYVSNGFKIRSVSGAQTNGSGNTIIYAAFASNPFGGSGAAPATAR